MKAKHIKTIILISVAIAILSVSRAVRPAELKIEPGELKNEQSSEDRGQASAEKQKKVLSIKAPPAVMKLWKKWAGKYVLFAHRDAGIKKFEDLSGKDLYCAVINVDFGIFGDAHEFLKVAEIKMTVALQNNPDYYGDQLLEDKKNVGMMVPSVAEAYKFAEEPKLVRLVLTAEEDHEPRSRTTTSQ